MISNVHLFASDHQDAMTSFIEVTFAGVHLIKYILSATSGCYLPEKAYLDCPNKAFPDLFLLNKPLGSRSKIVIESGQT